MSWGLYLTSAEFREAVKGFEDSVTAIADLANACAAIFEAGDAAGLSTARVRGGRAVAYQLVEEVERFDAHYREICKRTQGGA